MKLRYIVRPPCKKCPYTLGQVQFVVSPCPACKRNNYYMYDVLTSGKRGGEIREKE